MSQEAMMEFVADRNPTYNRWALVLRGIIAILFGIVTLFIPGLTLFTIVYLFASYAIVDGLLLAGTALFRRRTTSRWGILLLDGIVGILLGVVVVLWPGITSLVVLYLIAAWAIVTGLLGLAAAFTMSEYIANEWQIAIASTLAILLGIFLIIRPGIGILSILWAIGLFAIIAGVLILIHAFQPRSTSASVA